MEQSLDSAQGTFSALVAQTTDFLAGRSSLENTSILLALCTFAVLAMSWTARLGNNLGRFSPFTRSPTQGSSQVSDADFSYITADDLRRHGADGVGRQPQQQRAESPVEQGPPRDTDALVLRNKKKDCTVHFPAYSIAKGELTVGQVREHAAKKMGTADPRRIKLLYRGKNLKDDSRTCKQEGLRHEAELLCTVAESMPSASGSEDDEDEDEGVGLDGVEQSTADGEARRKRNRGKKTKRRNKREADRQQTSGTSTPSEYIGHLPPPPTSQAHSRAQSPKPPGTPMTPIDKINAIRDTLGTFLPQVQQFTENPPADQAKKDFDYKRLSETILAQVLLKLDGVETEGDTDARTKRKELVRETQAILSGLDAVMKR